MPLPKSHHPELPMVLRLAGLWLIYVSWCQTTGWVLSWLGSLHTTGYLAASPVALGLALWFWSATRPAAKRFSFSKWLRRIKASPSLAAWCVVTLLILIGALINPPSNYDGLTYRLPKLLYWLQESHWYWIDGIDFRLNITGAGIEWMSAPFILFTRSDRGLFLLNFLPFLLLPGLFFIAARGLGIRHRTARWWMWVWPMAYGIAIQAGSIGNDMLAAALGLASLAFAAHALRDRPWICLFFSALAAAAMTGIKATTLPLGLPLGIYWLWVAGKTVGWRKIYGLAAAVTPIALLVSFLPISILCWQHTGKWNGNPDNRHGFEPQHPVAALIGNSIEFSTGLIQPPILPASHTISRKLVGLVDQTTGFRWVQANYGCFNPSLNPEMPSEESAGIGLGITCIFMVWAFSRSRSGHLLPRVSSSIAPWFVAAVIAAMLAFTIKSGVGGTRRLMVPFTPFMILAAIQVMQAIKPHSQIHSRRFISILPALCLLPSLFFNPNRPIIPASALLSQPFIPESVQSRVRLVEESYAIRSHFFDVLLKKIPAGEAVAYGGNDHPLTSMFKPFRNKRRVVELLPATQDSVAWVIGLKSGIEQRMGMTLEEWEAQSGFTKAHEEILAARATTGRETWYVYHRPHGSLLPDSKP